MGTISKLLFPGKYIGKSSAMLVAFNYKREEY